MTDLMGWKNDNEGNGQHNPRQGSSEVVPGSSIGSHRPHRPLLSGFSTSMSSFEPTILSREASLSTMLASHYRPALQRAAGPVPPQPFGFLPECHTRENAGQAARENDQRQQLLASLLSASTVAAIGGSATTLPWPVSRPEWHHEQAAGLPAVNQNLITHALNQLESQSRQNQTPHLYFQHAYAATSVTSAEAQRQRMMECTGSPVLPVHHASNDVNEGTTTLFDDGIPLCLPVPLYRPGDNEKLSKLQCLLRQQIEVFQAATQDTSDHVRGRTKPVQVGQVGIRCRHCSYSAAVNRSKSSMFFPTSVWGIYQASQNMLVFHFQDGVCGRVPATTRIQFANHMVVKRPASGAGRRFWAEKAQQLGIVDTEDGMFFVRELPLGARVIGPDSGDNISPRVYQAHPTRRVLPNSA